MRRVLRSGLFTGLILVVLNMALTVAYMEHLRGNLHKLKQRIGNERPEIPTYKPGGQEPIILTRTRLMGDSAPEFTSVMLLPGRGMNVLQITAFVPGKGEVNLLGSPSLDDATRMMTTTGPDSGGAASLSMGGAFEAPWADGAGSGTPMWKGHALAGSGLAPAARQSGLLLAAASTFSDVTALPDGGQAEATFELGGDPAQWPWRTQVKIAVLLSSKSIDLTMTARNLGDSVEPIGLGWRPRFVIPGENTGFRLRLPAAMHLATTGGLPTGAVVPVAGTAYDFMSRGGVRPSAPLDDWFTDLRQDLLDTGPVADLSFPAEDYAVRLTALTPSIKSMHAVIPMRGGVAILAPQFNYPDPFGREWARGQDTGLVLLQPGQTTHWKVRLQILSPSQDGSGR